MIGHILLLVALAAIYFIFYQALDAACRRVSEKNTVGNIAMAIQLAVLIQLKLGWLLLIVGLVVLVILNGIFISRLYPTSDTTYFKKKKKENPPA